MLGAHVAIGGDVAQERHVELFGRGAEIFDLPTVQRIERAVHHRHAAAVLLEIVERQDHDRGYDFTSSPLSCSSFSALSKKSTATSGVVFASIVEPRIFASSFAMSRIVTVAPEPIFTGR